MMLLPDKHLRFSESILGLGAYVLDSLSSPKTIDDLWKNFATSVRIDEYPTAHSFENVVLAVDVLFAIGAVVMKPNGILYKCNS